VGVAVGLGVGVAFVLGSGGLVTVTSFGWAFGPSKKSQFAPKIRAVASTATPMSLSHLTIGLFSLVSAQSSIPTFQGNSL
jgi:hypothetical protein